MSNKNRILFVVNQAKYFISHRLILAEAASKNGYEVHIATPFGKELDVIHDERIKIHNFSINRSSKNIFNEIHTFISIYRIIYLVKPDIIHLISIKAVLYGGIIARIKNIPSVMAISGLGYLYSSGKKTILRKILRAVFRLSLDHVKNIIIVQNNSDKENLQELCSLKSSNYALIPGSGVNIKKFTPSPLPDSEPTILMPSRMLWDKGVGIFV